MRDERSQQTNARTHRLTHAHNIHSRGIMMDRLGFGLLVGDIGLDGTNQTTLETKV